MVHEQHINTSTDGTVVGTPVSNQRLDPPAKSATKKRQQSVLPVTGDIVLIEWEDASSLEHGWVDTEEPTEAQMASTVGFLVLNTDERVVVATTTDGRWVNTRFQIPKGMVRSMKVIKRKGPR